MTPDPEKKPISFDPFENLSPRRIKQAAFVAFMMFLITIWKDDNAALCFFDRWFSPFPFNHASFGTNCDAVRRPTNE